jgi:GNAT superfamily N-acetyltransferase
VEIREVTDLDLLKAYHQVEAAAFDNDFVALPADAIEELLPLVEGRQVPDEHVTFVVGFDGDAPVATACLAMPLLDNLQGVNLEVHVHPEHRRRGHGRAMLHGALDRVREAGRSRVFVQAPWTADGEEGPGFPLLREVGAHEVLVDVRRLLDLRAFPPADPVEPPAGYRLVQFDERAPDDLVDGLAYLLHRMVLDSPMGDMDYEPEKWDAARYRDNEAAIVDRHRTRLGTAVVDEATGEVAGVTELGKNAHRHDVAFQWSTIVRPDHRGHGLGMVLKSWNHRQLTERHPEARWVNTWNAASNSHMIAVNEALGFQPAERWSEWQLDL